jgi:hypothetical protein
MEGGSLARSILLLICLQLSGCYGLAVYGSYEHLSSVPLTDDLNTVDQLGVSVEFPLSAHPYATEMEIGLAWELDGRKPVMGPDPVGMLRIRQPVFRWKQ